ncbi:hypothetical protein H6S82_04920 [Planktothrix sp. FACHB-1355]|uniref:Uncharacterized protein n=1 Tax=Aerosakkonema funiforme FACHB-1375 TaxID=2949571 RepID=A0A926VDR6_9CYAN|nr:MULTISPECIES: hypothetical protein [Oscillatoriales]MBD2181963.1 hypothetical protein [Aerosakkonema funiforme FACHB-1375]MBD3558197.1 hypothetical protein [Planktothrix sp. FACHB-1355]
MAKATVQSLAHQWAKKYIENLQINSQNESSKQPHKLADIVSKAGREQTAEKLMHSLRFVSAQAWNKTEGLLAKEIYRHRINPRLINPWEIAADSFRIYEKALLIYTQQAPPRRLSVVMGLDNQYDDLDKNALEIYTEQIAPSQLASLIGEEIGELQNKYTANDPRVKGFVSMQLHYTSQMLLEMLSPTEQMLVGAYFKVIDDHFYMPLQRSYQAAAKLDYDSPVLAAVQQLLPESTKIAKKINERVIQLYPGYCSNSGALTDPTVQVSSIRDVEMFQVYLWVCALEENIAAIQQELFPLCVMLYPTLGVKWELLRQMLYLLGKEIRSRLTAEQAAKFMPYFQALWEMFSPDVFAALGEEGNLLAI